MKSRPRNRDTSKVDALISQAGDDPEVATQSTPTSPAVETKAAKKTGKVTPRQQGLLQDDALPTSRYPCRTS